MQQIIQSLEHRLNLKQLSLSATIRFIVSGSVFVMSPIAQVMRNKLQHARFLRTPNY
jgi:hypothetical protein